MPRHAANAARWVEKENNRGRNCYYTLNEVKANNAPYDLAKPDKGDIVALAGFHTDVDPVGEGDYNARRARLLNGTRDRVLATEPTLVVDSGNGLQPVYLLDKPWPIDRLDEVESQNRGLLDRFEGDVGTWAADRLLRVPFTVNYSSPKKVQKGYPEQTQATVVHVGARRADATGLPPPKAQKPDKQHDTVKAPKEIPEAKQAKLLERFNDYALVGNAQLRDRYEYAAEDGLADTSRSGFDRSIALMLKAEGFTYNEFCFLVQEQPPEVSAFPDKAADGDWRYFHRAYYRDVDETMEPSDQPGLKVTAWDSVPDIEPPLVLVESTLTVPATSLLIAEPNTGKSAMALDMAVAIASGADWNRKRVMQAGVLYVAVEAEASIVQRIRPYQAELKGLPFHVVGAQSFDLSTAAGREQVLGLVLAAVEPLPDPVRFIVIDTLSDAAPAVDENAPEFGAVVQWGRRLAEQLDCHVMFAHHKAKHSQGSRGHTSVPAKADTIIELYMDNSGVATATYTKQRDLPSRGLTFKFGFDSVDTGQLDNLGHPVTVPRIHYNEMDLAPGGPDPVEEAEQTRFAILDEFEKAGRHIGRDKAMKRLKRDGLPTFRAEDYSPRLEAYAAEGWLEGKPGQFQITEMGTQWLGKNRDRLEFDLFR
ncbi:AAA family ATPase [Parahaliea maris]|nr:AAA family ATPase [Parahaliea maris]